jgi:hypothetical protein
MNECILCSVNERNVYAIHIEPNGNDTKFKNVIQNLSWNTLYASYMSCLCKVYIAVALTLSRITKPASLHLLES